VNSPLARRETAPEGVRSEVLETAEGIGIELGTQEQSPPGRPNAGEAKRA